MVAYGQIVFAQKENVDVFKIEIQNVKLRYNESEIISPLLVNAGTRSIFLLTREGAIDPYIFSYDKNSKTWNVLLTDLRCGNEITIYREIKPGEKLNLQLFWGFAWDYFKMNGLTKGKFKIGMYYASAMPKDWSETIESFVAESKPFELSVKKEITSPKIKSMSRTNE